MRYSDRPWLKSYKLGPYKLEETLEPYPQIPLFKLLDEAAERYPNQTAILFLERSISYKVLKVLVDKFAKALVRLGVKKGDRVVVLLPNCIEFIISDWAILKAGAVVVPTSILRTNEGLIHEIGSSDSKIIICREEQLNQVLKIKEACDIEHIIVTSTEGFDIREVAQTLPKGVYEFRKLLEENEPNPPKIEISPKEDLCELAFTGGATGIPKGVMITHFNRYSCILQGFPWMLKPLLRGIIGKASVFVPIPLFHSYGHYVEQAAAYLGLRIILIPDPRDTETIVKYLQKYRPLMITTVPTQLMRIAEAKVGKMNVIPMSGSAPLPLKIAEAIKKEIGMPVSEGYGLTETSPLTHFNISAFSKITGFMSIEKTGIGIPSPDTECKLVDPVTNEEVPFGEPGEIVVRGPQIMKGYWPEAGSGLTDDGWLHTGDIAFMDEDGYFHMSDRIKDMVNVSGMKVYTSIVDEVLYKYPGVQMAASYGIPDPEIPGSERIMATIKLKAGFKGKISSEDIKEFCRCYLPPYAIPKFIEFRESIPLTVTEKIFKRLMRDEAIAKMKEKGEIKF